MDNLTLVQRASSSLPTAAISTPSSAQSENAGPRSARSGILGQWEHDRFGTDGRSNSSPIGRGQGQEKSTVSSWRAFAQSNTSQPLPPLRDRNAVAEDVRRKEDWRACPGPTAGAPCPRLPTAPPQRQRQGPTRGSAQVASQPRSHAETPSHPEPIPQDQALRKRKSEVYPSQNGDSSANVPQAKRASPDRPSPLSAAVTDDIVNNGVATSSGTLQRPRRPSFERWVSSRSRPHIVAPNGTTIVPSSLQPRRAVSQRQSPAITTPQATTQNGANCTPESQPRKSSPTAAWPISRPQSPSFPSQITPSTTPSTPTPEATTPAASPPKSRAKTTDDIARRMIFAGIGAGRVPKRTEEELKKRQEEQERRRVQREEREKLGKEEVMKWCGINVVKPEMKTGTHLVSKEESMQSTVEKPGVNELTKFNGEEIQW